MVETTSEWFWHAQMMECGYVGATVVCMDLMFVNGSLLSHFWNVFVHMVACFCVFCMGFYTRIHMWTTEYDDSSS